MKGYPFTMYKTEANGLGNELVRTKVVTNSIDFEEAAKIGYVTVEEHKKHVAKRLADAAEVEAERAEKEAAEAAEEAARKAEEAKERARKLREEAGGDGGDGNNSGDGGGDKNEIPPKDASYDDMTKKVFDKWAEHHFGIKLNGRMNKDLMVDQFKQELAKQNSE